MIRQVRHEFNPGPPSNPRKVNWYGRLERGKLAKRYRINRLHAQALVEDAQR